MNNVTLFAEIGIDCETEMLVILIEVDASVELNADNDLHVRVFLS